MRELEEVAQITGDSWEVMHPYLVKRFGQLMDGASLPGGGAFLGTLDHSVLLQAQGSAKTKLDGDLQSRFAKLEGQVANMKQGDKPKPSSRPRFLTTAEYEVYKEWRTLHPSVCQSAVPHILQTIELVRPISALHTTASVCLVKTDGAVAMGWLQAGAV
jgi:hypothetical protein